MNEPSGAEGERAEEARRVWQRIDAQVPSPVLRAMAGAFAVVACADGELDSREVDRFLGLVRQEEVFGAQDMETLEGLFRELCAELLRDFGSARARALGLVMQARGEPEATELVVAAAQIAIVADERLMPSEERLLAEICGALGIDSSTR